MDIDSVVRAFVADHPECIPFRAVIHTECADRYAVDSASGDPVYMRAVWTHWTPRDWSTTARRLISGRIVIQATRSECRSRRSWHRLTRVIADRVPNTFGAMYASRVGLYALRRIRRSIGRLPAGVHC